jgi:hypothetical protein
MATYEPMVTPLLPLTFNEAIEYMKMRDKHYPGASPVKWVNSKTGKRVYIGYSN